MEIPKRIKRRLKIIHKRYYKDDDWDYVLEIYERNYKKQKEEHPDTDWSDMIYHRRAINKLKNKNKKESFGGTVDKFFGVILGADKVRDLSSNRRQEVYEAWEKDPLEAMEDGLVMYRKKENPQTGEVEKVPIQDNEGNIIPRDNRKYFKRKDGSKFKNNNYGQAIGHSYRRTLVGFVQKVEDGICGVGIIELRDMSTELDIPYNKPVKFSGRTSYAKGSEIEKLYFDKDTLKENLVTLDLELEADEISKEFHKEMKEHTEKLIKGKEWIGNDVNVFKITSTKKTDFVDMNEKELEALKFPKDEDGIDIGGLYRQEMIPFSSDCSNIVEYHEDHRYIDNDPDQINWDEFVCLHNVNVIQKNTEASASGNFTLYVEDESLFLNEIVHNDEIIEGIKVLARPHVDLKFGQDSKVNIIGSVVQFQAQNDDNEGLTEEVENAEGEIVEKAIMDFPMIFAFGIYPIPEYKVKVEDTIDQTYDEEDIDVDKIVNGEDGGNSDEVVLSEEEKKEIEELNEMKKKVQEKVKENKENKEESEESEKEQEDEVDIW